jgi:hypothetical protein
LLYLNHQPYRVSLPSGGKILPHIQTRCNDWLNEKLCEHNLFLDAGLDHLLGLVERLSLKIAQIDATGFLDASVLGETVHPRNFNSLRRIKDEDGSIIQEQEDFVELASSEFMLQQLKALLASGAQ